MYFLACYTHAVYALYKFPLQNKINQKQRENEHKAGGALCGDCRIAVPYFLNRKQIFYIVDLNRQREIIR